MKQKIKSQSGRQIRLTSLASCAGWASKLSAETLEQVLSPIKEVFATDIPTRLLIGLDNLDDAAVWQIDRDNALVLTVDFFPPVVDDAYDYGAIAAANSLSDVYAMGGEPFLALNITAFPPNLDVAIQQDILRGAAEKVREAGAVIAGGHSIWDKEPKFGLVVLGNARIHNLLTKRAAEPGDRLVVTKPLGFGVITTALKQGQANPEDVLDAVSWMKTLNKNASQLAIEFNLKAATDITGFGLLGHAWEMAKMSQVGIQIDHRKVPFLEHARKYARAGCFPGGASDNRLFYGNHTSFSNLVDEITQMLLFDPQTSGGLLLAIPEDVFLTFMSRAKKLDQPAWEVGFVMPGNTIEVV